MDIDALYRKSRQRGQMRHARSGDAPAFVAHHCFGAFSSEVGTGSREKNAPEQEGRASLLILSEAKRFW
jgi:hypothetical protein